MCTVSWRAAVGGVSGGYDLWFNRDESRQRPAADPPEVHGATTGGGLPFISATDPVGGGTWLSVNGRGVTVGILNLYEAEVHHQPADPISRGALVNGLAPSASVGAAGHALTREIDARGQRYRPFLLVVLGLDTPEPTLHRWDGVALTENPAVPPVTTSSFETEVVRAERTAAFDPAATPLETYHRSQQPGRKEYSVLMERPDACTVSITHVHVGGGSVTMRYFAPPTAPDPLATVAMPLDDSPR